MGEQQSVLQVQLDDYIEREESRSSSRSESEHTVNDENDAKSNVVSQARVV